VFCVDFDCTKVCVPSHNTGTLLIVHRWSHVVKIRYVFGTNYVKRRLTDSYCFLQICVWDFAHSGLDTSFLTL
jgi:hypothetical protein